MSLSPPDFFDFLLCFAPFLSFSIPTFEISRTSEGDLVRPQNNFCFFPRYTGIGMSLHGHICPRSITSFRSWHPGNTVTEILKCFDGHPRKTPVSHRSHLVWSWTIPEPGIIPDFGLCKPRIQLEVKRQRYSSVPGTLSTQTSDDILHEFVFVRAVIALLYAVITVWEPRLQSWVMRPARYHGYRRRYRDHAQADQAPSSSLDESN